MQRTCFVLSSALCPHSHAVAWRSFIAEELWEDDVHAGCAVFEQEQPETHTPINDVVAGWQSAFAMAQWRLRNRSVPASRRVQARHGRASFSHGGLG